MTNRRRQTWIPVLLAALVGSIGFSIVPSVAIAAPAQTVATPAAKASKSTKPKITRQPKAVTVRAGTKARFRVAAKGQKLSYQWQVKKSAGGWKPVKGKAGKKKLLVVRATKKTDGFRYRAVVKSRSKKATSRAAKLTVITKPQISAQPKTVRVDSGTSVTFAVAAGGGALKYQWQVSTDDKKTWKAASNGRKTTLNIRAATTNAGNYYRVQVSNRVGKVTSSEALLWVDSTRTDPARSGDVILLNEWGVGVSYQIGEIIDTGDGVVMATIVACYSGPGSADAWWDLDVEYLGNNNVVYDNAGIYLDGDIYDAPTVYAGGCVSFIAFAVLPPSAIGGGVWVITERSGLFDRHVAYVAGP